MAGHDPLVAIGKYIFYCTQPSFNTLRTTIEPRWIEQERLMRAPAGQWIGPSNPTVDLTGIIYPVAFPQKGSIDPRGMIDLMCADASNGTIFTVLGMSPGTGAAFNAGTYYI